MLWGPSPVPGFSSPYSPRRLSVWQRSLGLMSRRWRGLPVGSYACRPHATLIHSMPWVSISRRMLWEPPCRASQTLFICLADRTHPSVGGGGGGGIVPYRRLHGSSRPDIALCPLISRGWWPVGPVRRLRELSHCRQLGSSWPGLQPRCSSIGGQGSPVPMRWAITGPRLSQPRPVAPKPWSLLRRSGGPTHACQTAPSEHVDPPGLPQGTPGN